MDLLQFVETLWQRCQRNLFLSSETFSLEAADKFSDGGKVERLVFVDLQQLVETLWQRFQEISFESSEILFVDSAAIS